jgi:hypothetical protein
MLHERPDLLHDLCCLTGLGLGGCFGERRLEQPGDGGLVLLEDPTGLYHRRRLI